MAFYLKAQKFAERCKKEGIVFVGPSTDVIAISGDKVKARNAASKVVSMVQGGEVSNEKKAFFFGWQDWLSRNPQSS